MTHLLDPVTDDRGYLEDIFERQEKFMDSLHSARPSTETGVKETILALIVEAVEVLNEINWKPWKRQRHIVSIKALQEEVVDVFHFVIELAILVGLDANSLYDGYRHKMAVNIDRQREEKK